MDRECQHYSDYSYIRVWGAINAWSVAFTRGQQKHAYLLNAPRDTIEIDEDKPIRFSKLNKENKSKFKKVLMGE